MRILFFDMEFADGRVPGSIYSIGYVVTDGNFRIKKTATDLLINPESSWNSYVKKNILAYPIEEVRAAPNFPAHYKRIKKLFEKADVAIGFAVCNDTSALRKDCLRYQLEPISYRYFDAEPVCRSLSHYQNARGLAKCVEDWCGEVPQNQHRSDGDAYATMRLMEAMCKAKHVTVEMMMEAYPECTGRSCAEKKRKRGFLGLFGRKKNQKVKQAYSNKTHQRSKQHEKKH